MELTALWVYIGLVAGASIGSQGINAPNLSATESALIPRAPANDESKPSPLRGPVKIVLKGAPPPEPTVITKFPSKESLSKLPAHRQHEIPRKVYRIRDLDKDSKGFLETFAMCRECKKPSQRKAVVFKVQDLVYFAPALSKTGEVLESGFTMGFAMGGREWKDENGLPREQTTARAAYMKFPGLIDDSNFREAGTLGAFGIDRAIQKKYESTQPNDFWFDPMKGVGAWATWWQAANPIGWNNPAKWATTSSLLDAMLAEHCQEIEDTSTPKQKARYHALGHWQGIWNQRRYGKDNFVTYKENKMHLVFDGVAMLRTTTQDADITTPGADFWTYDISDLDNPTLLFTECGAYGPRDAKNARDCKDPIP